MTRLILTCLSICYLFSAHTQKIIKSITPSVKQVKKQVKNLSKPQKRKAPTQTPAFAELELVLVKGNLFTMGDVFEKDLKKQNPPIHNETVNDFYIAKHEVSQWLWSVVMDKNPAYHFRYQCPVEMVSWEEIQVFIKKLNEMTGRKFRLPTETEWEYAAREEGKEVLYGNGKMEADALKINFMGIEKNTFSGINTNNLSSTSYKADPYDPNNLSTLERKPAAEANSTVYRSFNQTGFYRQETTPKGSFSSNKLGLYDMAGNVAEWCSTCGTKEELNIGNETKFVCIVRGGSWYTPAEKCMTFYRSFAEPTVKDSGIGFRLAEDVD
jgi:formylglycine-generating enzyme